MKVAFIILVLFVAACKPYKVTGLMAEMPSASKEAMYEAKPIKGIGDLPRRIRNIPDFKYQACTSDTALFRTSKGKISLFCGGVYNQATKAGYIIQYFLSSYGISSQCTLFWVQNNTLLLDFYGLPPEVKSWDEMQLYLHHMPGRIFGGGVGVFKESYYKRKRRP